MARFLRILSLLLVMAFAVQASATTWYVRPDGGTRYSANYLTGQCNGTMDAAYPGSGTNQPCAYKDVRWLYTDPGNGSRAWVGTGGDTYLLRGTPAQGVTYRIGWNNNSNAKEQLGGVDTYYGIPGDPYSSGMPPPPSGTSSQHTRILGENYASCHAQSARTQLHGGYGVSSVINLQGASYVDVQCVDITDFSACGRSGQVFACNTNPGTLDDFAAIGVSQDNTTTHVSLADVRLHGLATTGLAGPNGDVDVYTYIDILGNGASGWNADNGTVGKGSALMQNFSISWNGCTEQYPIVDTLPYSDCAGQENGGYGDGFGTASIDSTVPWNITFDKGTVSYNMQDGLDALHLVGAGSSMTITRVLAYGNMGQQIKVGGSSGSASNNVIIGNCNALKVGVPGTPSGYNANLKPGDTCRASDTVVYMSVQDGAKVVFTNNTVYSAASTGVQIGCNGSCTGTDLIDFRNNIFLGFLNSSANGYTGGGTGDYSNPIYLSTSDNPFTNPGSYFDHNLTYHAKSNWSCPNSSFGETNARCVDPGLTVETWSNYALPNTAIAAPTSAAYLAGIRLTGMTTDLLGNTYATVPSLGAQEFTGPLPIPSRKAAGRLRLSGKVR